MRKLSNISNQSQAAEHNDRNLLFLGRIRPAAAWIGLILTPLLLYLGSMLVSFLIWAYAVEQAGVAIDQGMTWPEPRLATSLPIGHDQHQLQQALDYLWIAVRWRPDHAHAYRLMGHVYAAKGEWAAAAEALERAQARAPKNPLPAWETGLIYQHMQYVIGHVPFDSLMPPLSSAQLETPNKPIETPFCREGQPKSCYSGTTTFYQPYAAFPDGPLIRSQAVFLHTPATIAQRLFIPADRSGLRFMIGLDPAARSHATDGATFRVWVTPENGTQTLVYEHTIDRTTALQGWVPGWANLSSWAGQTITLTIGTDAGPDGDPDGDWYGWGNIGLTAPEAAYYSSIIPRLRMLQAWHNAGLSTEQIKRYDK